MNVMYFNAVKVIHVGRGCIVLLINDSDCTIGISLHTNDLHFATCPIHNIYHTIMCGVSVHSIFLQFLCARVFSQLVPF